MGDGVSREACGTPKVDVGGSAPGLSIAPGALVPLAGDMRPRGPDRDQRQRLGWAAHCQQPMQVIQAWPKRSIPRCCQRTGRGFLERKRTCMVGPQRMFEHIGMWMQCVVGKSRTSMSQDSGNSNRLTCRRCHLHNVRGSATPLKRVRRLGCAALSRASCPGRADLADLGANKGPVVSREVPLLDLAVARG